MQQRNEGRMAKVRRLSTGCGILIGLFFALISVCPGQVDRSALNGTVTDSAGLALPDVGVVAVQDFTGLRRTTVSSRSGAYEIPELPIGLYTVTFSREGFQPLTFANVIQELAKTRTLNASLKVGGPKEHIEVPLNQPRTGGTGRI
jgi:Carboxypeptidase regulatory-like domain